MKDAQRVYAPYLWYLQAEGVLDKALDEQLANVATRAQMAHVLANLLPETVLPPVNDSLITQAYASRRRITDVTEYTPYYNDILKLYRCGISVGSDETGSFLPDSPITRGAAAAMLTRMVDPSLRLTPDWHLPDFTAPRGPPTRIWSRREPTSPPQRLRRTMTRPSAICSLRGKTPCP